VPKASANAPLWTLFELTRCVLGDGAVALSPIGACLRQADVGRTRVLRWLDGDRIAGAGESNLPCQSKCAGRDQNR